MKTTTPAAAQATKKASPANADAKEKRTHAMGRSKAKAAKKTARIDETSRESNLEKILLDDDFFKILLKNWPSLTIEQKGELAGKAVSAAKLALSVPFMLFLVGGGEERYFTRADLLRMRNH